MMMADPEKIISEFERWIGWMDEDCPQIAIDALALMKQQKQEYDQLQGWATGHGLTLCKDCKYWKKKTMLSLPNAFPVTCECEKIYRIESENQFNEMRRTAADWFCADGKRRRDT